MFKTAKVYWSHLSSAKDLVVLAALAFATLGFFMVSQSGSAQGARDCDSNAILHCGAYSVSELSSKYNAADAKARGAFNHYGVQAADFNSLVEGSVTRDGRVVVNGRTVASNVTTVGRQYMPGSTQISGGAYVRPPSVSFNSNSLSAFVMMEGDRFLYAIIKSCGNPAGNGAIERGSVSLTQGKTTAPAEGSQVSPGDTIHYQMTVKNSGNVEASTVSIADAIPAGTSYVEDSFETVGDTPQPDLFEFDGNRILAAWHRVPAGAERTIKFRVTVNNGVTDGHDICNIATTDAEEVEPQQTNRVCHEVEIPEEEPKNIVCRRLSASPESGEAPLLVDFAVSVTADEGVEVESFVFDFDENGTEVVEAENNTATVRETFEDGTYDVRVTEMRTNIGTAQVQEGDCAVTITAEEPDEPQPEPEPSFACVSLTANPNSGRAPLDVTLTVTGRATNTEIVGYAFDLDSDGTYDEAIPTTATTATLEHTFSEDATVRAIMVTEEGQTEVTSACTAAIDIETTPPPTPPQEALICSGLSREDIDYNTKKFTVHTQGNADVADNGYQFEVDGQALERQDSNMLTRDFSDGEHEVKARVYYDDQVTDFSDCVNEFTVTTPPQDNPPELPDTGAAGALSAVFGTTTIGQGLRMWLASRKKLFGALLDA